MVLSSTCFSEETLPLEQNKCEQNLPRSYNKSHTSPHEMLDPSLSTTPNSTLLQRSVLGRVFQKLAAVEELKHEGHQELGEKLGHHFPIGIHRQKCAQGLGCLLGKENGVKKGNCLPPNIIQRARKTARLPRLLQHECVLVSRTWARHSW